MQIIQKHINRYINSSRSKNHNYKVIKLYDKKHINHYINSASSKIHNHKVINLQDKKHINLYINRIKKDEKIKTYFLLDFR
jgi:hypothetical protein